MALPNTSASKNSLSSTSQNRKLKKKYNTKSKKKLKKTQKLSPTESDNSQPKQLTSSPSHRNKSPGVRLINGRIYDSDKGKTCHQCRQKTMDFAVSCKILKCTLHFCHKCLINRYGENAEEVAILVDWKCPRCRGICNCSFCMKKRGFRPTGLLVRTAKATGFSSVAEMLLLKGSEKFMNNNVCASSKKRTAPDEELGEDLTKTRRKENSFDGKSCKLKDKPKKVIKDAGGSSKKPIGPNKGPKLASVRGRQKGNVFDGKSNSKSHCKTLKMIVDEKEIKNGNLKRITKHEGDKNSPERKQNDGTSNEKCGPKRHSISKEASKRNEKTYREVEVNTDQGSNGKPSRSIKIEENEMNMIDNAAVECKQVNGFCRSKKEVEVHSKDSDVEILLPQRMELKNVADIDLPPADIGHALQFLEFCEAFGQVLCLKKGQPESLLREIASGQSSCRRHDSSIVQFHIKLLSMIQKESQKEDSFLKTGGRNSWIQALTKFLSKAEFPSKELLLGCLSAGADGYEDLNSSKRLRLLNFLCDEALGTVELRSWIDEQNFEFVEDEKKKFLIEKEREKNIKKNLQDEAARVVLVQNGTPLSISEHEDLISKIKAAAAQTIAETLEAMRTVMKKKERSDAVRAEPILSDTKGRRFWKLRGYSGKMGILLQDFGSGDLVSFEERWFTYDLQEKENVEKYISSLKVANASHLGNE